MVGDKKAANILAPHALGDAFNRLRNLETADRRRHQLSRRYRPHHIQTSFVGEQPFSGKEIDVADHSDHSSIIVAYEQRVNLFLHETARNLRQGQALTDAENARAHDVFNRSTHGDFSGGTRETSV